MTKNAEGNNLQFSLENLYNIFTSTPPPPKKINAICIMDGEIYEDVKIVKSLMQATHEAQRQQVTWFK